MNTKEKWETTITIHDEHRAAVWGSIFPGAVVPIKSILPSKADLPGHPGANVYLPDLDAISEEERAKLIEYMAHLFSMSEDEVLSDLERGVPILADNTSIASCDQGLMFSLIADDVLDSRLSRIYTEEDDDEGLGFDDPEK